MDLIGLIPTFGGFVWTLLAFIVALSVIVAVHEFGHYIVGRWTGIHAEVFSLGFGPVLYSRRDSRGTLWQIAALPLGGYVRFLGDADAASAGRDEAALATLDEREARRTMHGAPLWARALTVAAGPAFNFALSILVFAGVLALRGVVAEPLIIESISSTPFESGLMPGDVILAVDDRDTPTAAAFGQVRPQSVTATYLVRRDGEEVSIDGPSPALPIAGAVIPASAAADAGMRGGDVILTVDGTRIGTFEELSALVRGSNGKPVEFGVWRAGEEVQIVVVPRREDVPVADGFDTQWRVGVAAGYPFEFRSESPGAVTALTYGLRSTWSVVDMSLSGIRAMVSGEISPRNVVGPLGIAQASGAAARQGGLEFLQLVALISTAVGLLNLFPIPILDGGHLALYAYEAVAGRPPSDRAMRILMSVGIALLLALMTFALSNDLHQLFRA